MGLEKLIIILIFKKIAKCSEKDFLRLMNDVRIIRNKLKINAAIYNAQEIIKIQKEFGSFRKFLDFYVKENKNDKNLWLKLFKNHFKLVGGEIVGEFLLSIDMLSGNHDKNCIVKKKNK